MADVNVSIADAGVLAGAVGGVKSRTEPGSGKDKAGAGDERADEFEQLVAKGDRTRGAEADSKTEKADETPKRLPKIPVASDWSWSEGLSADARNDKVKTEETEAGEGKNAGEHAVLKTGMNVPAEALLLEVPAGSTAANEAVTAQQADRGTDKRLKVDVGGSRTVGETLENPGADGKQGQADAKGAKLGLESGEAQSRVAGSRGEPARTAEVRGAEVPEQRQNAPANQAAPSANSKVGAPMQPGAVEPAAVQLAAVLAQGKETGKRGDSVRTTSEAPAKIQVSLAETHFSPIKPHSELEAHDLAQRMDGRTDKDLGRSLRDSLRLQAGLRQDLRTERTPGSGQAQGDVRAEMLAQNFARPVSGGDIAGQIGTKILEELEQSRSSNETRNSGVVQVKQSDPALKILEIRLEPRELGSVVVRMSLRNDVLNVELGFGKSEAAAAIAKSTDQLSNYLRSSGYDVDAIVVRVADGDRAAPVTNTVANADGAQGQTNSGSSSSQGMAGQSFGEQGERRPAGREGQPAHQNSAEGSHAPDNSQPRSSRDLFV